MAPAGFKGLRGPGERYSDVILRLAKGVSAIALRSLVANGLQFSDRLFETHHVLFGEIP
jgi:hypothetical protein